MTSVDPMFHPVAGDAHLDRLEALPAGPDLTPEFWDIVDSEIQEQLARLETEIRRSIGPLRATRGRTKGEAFSLFSYRTFSLPGDATDPVVASVAFTAALEGVKVEADVSGETMGDMIVKFPIRTVPPSREEILAAARAAARDLFGVVDSIVAAVQDASRMLD